MNQPFTIHFDFKLDSKRIETVQLEATVHLYHSIPHYKVQNIKVKGQKKASPLLPDLDLICTTVRGKHKWVHKHTGRGSDLSKAIGLAIENSNTVVELATYSRSRTA